MKRNWDCVETLKSCFYHRTTFEKFLKALYKYSTFIHTFGGRRLVDGIWCVVIGSHPVSPARLTSPSFARWQHFLNEMCNMIGALRGRSAVVICDHSFITVIVKMLCSVSF